MAVITNVATLTYSGGTVTSNVTQGELLTTLSVSKTASSTTYSPGERIVYAINLVNTGTATLTDLTLTDDLGAFDFGGTSLTPLTFVDDSVRYFVNGIPETAGTATAGPPLSVGGITVPAGGNATILYTAIPNEYAPLAEGSTITNAVTVTGNNITCPASATETVSVRVAPLLSIAKAMSPSIVTENGEVTYTLTVSNSGNAEAVATDSVVISDTFSPRLGNVTVTLNGEPLTEGTDYTYDEATGAFATTLGTVTVPAATFTQDPTSGEQTVTPGVAILTVTGTVLGCADSAPAP